jgi:hypothetical protein
MAEILCPLCGKPNPADSESCSNCGARIKQITAPLDPIKPGELPTKKDTSDLERTLPSWLRDARQAASEDAPAKPESPSLSDSFSFDFNDSEPSEPAPASDMPDFLKKAMSADSAPGAPVDFLAGLSQTADDEEEIPEWLSGLRANAPETPPAVPPAATPADSGSSDWLSGLQDEQPAAPSAPASPTSDWGFGSSQAFDFNALDEPEQPAASSGDWLSSLNSGQPAAQENAGLSSDPIDSGTPDWLKNLDSSTLDQSAPQQGSPFNFADTPASGDTPSWLADLESPAATTPDASSTSPDWLSSLGAPASETPAASAGETPDWLSSLSTPETSAQPAAETPSTGDNPDWLSSLGASAAETPAARAGETPDWLSSLSTPGTASQPAAETPSADDNTNWLSSLGAPAAETPAASAGETPDWLSSLSTPETASQPAAETPAADDNTDWLSSLGAPAAETPAASAGETPDWLSSLSTPETTSQPAAETPAADDNTDWLSSLGAPAAETPVASAGETPDWLSSFSTPETASQPAAETPAADNNADWLSSLGAPAAETPAASSGETPDWLSSLSTPETASQPAVETPAVDDNTDWLSSLGAPAAETPAASEGETSDWLSSFSIPETASQPAVETPAAETSAPTAGESSDWLSGLGQATDGEAAPAEEMPDWLAGLQESRPAPAEPPVREPEGLALSGPSSEDLSTMPDWLAESLGEKPAEPEEKPASSISKPFQTGTLAGINMASDAGSMPDWLAGLGASSGAPESNAADSGSDWLSGLSGGQEKPVETVGQPQGDDISAGSMPGFVEQPASESLPGAFDQSPFGQSDDSLLSMDMPDWLAGFKPAEQPAETPDAGEDVSLAQTELPSWVQAMRPVETVVRKEQDEEQGEVEKAGPLAGLRNTLPVAGALEIKKPRPYSIKVQASELQQAQSALLEELLLSETTPRPMKAQVRVVVDRTFRWIVAGVLLLAVLIPSMLGGGWLPKPTAMAIDTSDFILTIDALPPDSPVLVVTDYQPGFAGELEAAASPILDHLMLRGARLSFVSSSPSGPLMAERLISRQAGTHSYQLGQQYLYLGYLPGGAAGIKVFADNPSAVAGTNTVAGNLWITPPLEGVTRFSDFAAVVVLVDNPDDGRLWVEQAQPQLAGNPMLMVISAQAEPMIRPYYDSGQLSGLVAGLSGGMAYETYLIRPGKASDFWDAYGISLIAAEALILFGSVWGLWQGFRARKSRQAEEA